MLTLAIFDCDADELIIDRMAGRTVCPSCGASYHKTNKPSKVKGSDVLDKNKESVVS